MKEKEENNICVCLVYIFPVYLFGLCSRQRKACPVDFLPCKVAAPAWADQETLTKGTPGLADLTCVFSQNFWSCGISLVWFHRIFWFCEVRISTSVFSRFFLQIVMNKIGQFFRQQTRPLSSSIGKFISPLDFKPKKALVVTKVSRYEFERSKFSDLSESEFENVLTKRGSDYTMIK